MYKFLILMAICFLFQSCSKTNTPTIPNDIELDIDNDGSIDFMVNYVQAPFGDPVGNYDAISMFLVSMDNNEVLKKEDERIVFLHDIQTIQSSVELPLYWELTNPTENISFTIARIRTQLN